MKTLLPFKLEDVQIQLHFKNLSQINTGQPVKLQAQDSRMGFIQYCLSQGKNLKSAEVLLEDYQKEPTPTLPTGHVIAEISPGDLNRQKLAALFAHTAAIGYEFGELSIEPIAVNDLITKMHQINEMSDEDAAAYLQKIVGHKIPACDQINMEEFLAGIAHQYKQPDGVNFHCYLRENFLNDLDVKNIKAAEPTLNYFMPAVFTQQHINSCEVATTLTMLKKVMSNFQQMQETCLDSSKPLSPEVIKAKEEIKKLEDNFQQYITNPTGFKPDFIKDIHAQYLKQCEIIQVEMEVGVKNAINKDIELYVKQNKNHALATWSYPH